MIDLEVIYSMNFGITVFKKIGTFEKNIFLKFIKYNEIIRGDITTKVLAEISLTWGLLYKIICLQLLFHFFLAWEIGKSKDVFSEKC